MILYIFTHGFEASFTTSMSATERHISLHDCLLLQLRGIAAVYVLSEASPMQTDVAIVWSSPYTPKTWSPSTTKTTFKEINTLKAQLSNGFCINIFYLLFSDWLRIFGYKYWKLALVNQNNFVHACHGPGHLLNFCSHMTINESDKACMVLLTNINCFSMVFNGPNEYKQNCFYTVQICMSWIWISICYNQLNIIK